MSGPHSFGDGYVVPSSPFLTRIVERLCAIGLPLPWRAVFHPSLGFWYSLSLGVFSLFLQQEAEDFKHLTFSLGGDALSTFVLLLKSSRPNCKREASLVLVVVYSVVLLFSVSSFVGKRKKSVVSIRPLSHGWWCCLSFFIRSIGPPLSCAFPISPFGGGPPPLAAASRHLVHVSGPG